MRDVTWMGDVICMRDVTRMRNMTWRTSGVAVVRLSDVTVRLTCLQPFPTRPVFHPTRLVIHHRRRILYPLRPLSWRERLVFPKRRGGGTMEKKKNLKVMRRAMRTVMISVMIRVIVRVTIGVMILI